jgi:hypothetical protein
MTRAVKYWSQAEWESFILRDRDYWDMVSTLLSGHPKLYLAGGFDKFLVCTACEQFVTAQEAHSCPNGSLLSWKDATSGDEVARTAFAHAWIKSVFYKPPKGLKRRGPAQEVPAQLLIDFKQELLRNADSLIDEAILLFQNQRYPRAALLALVAQEELVKMGWASIEAQNPLTYFYLFPIEGCKPGFTFQRLSLAMRGLRLETRSRGVEQFKWEEKYNLLKHEAKLAIVKLAVGYFLAHRGSTILELEHYDKYRLLYGKAEKPLDRKAEKPLERYRYVDIDFDHSALAIPDKVVSREEAYDHIVFAAALCHDWAWHGLCDQTGRIRDFGPYEDFVERAQQRYQNLLSSYGDIKSEVFPTPHLTEAERIRLAEEEKTRRAEECR